MTILRCRMPGFDDVLPGVLAKEYRKDESSKVPLTFPIRTKSMSTCQQKGELASWRMSGLSSVWQSVCAARLGINELWTIGHAYASHEVRDKLTGCGCIIRLLNTYACVRFTEQTLSILTPSKRYINVQVTPAAVPPNLALKCPGGMDHELFLRRTIKRLLLDCSGVRLAKPIKAAAQLRLSSSYAGRNRDPEVCIYPLLQVAAT
jgi:hypothetical protein